MDSFLRLAVFFGWHCWVVPIAQLFPWYFFEDDWMDFSRMAPNAVNSVD